VEYRITTDTLRVYVDDVQQGTNILYSVAAFDDPIQDRLNNETVYALYTKTGPSVHSISDSNGIAGGTLTAVTGLLADATSITVTFDKDITAGTATLYYVAGGVTAKVAANATATTSATSTATAIHGNSLRLPIANLLIPGASPEYVIDWSATANGITEKGSITVQVEDGAGNTLVDILADPIRKLRAKGLTLGVTSVPSGTPANSLLLINQTTPTVGLTLTTTNLSTINPSKLYYGYYGSIYTPLGTTGVATSDTSNYVTLAKAAGVNFGGQWLSFTLTGGTPHSTGEAHQIVIVAYDDTGYVNQKTFDITFAP
jgi:hypothetical protein